MPEANVPVPEARLKALSIAASVFSQITTTLTIVPKVTEGPYIGPYTIERPRTLKDFRESVDAVFKAAGLEKVEWK